ncbi:MAG: Gfo/Idh/MocA family oxidoreductase [bacterium]
MLTGAIIGFGQVVEHGHIPAFSERKENFSIKAVADADPERRRRALELLPAARVYSSHEELFAKESGLEFADIATPPAMHPGHVAAALEKGLHVLCEKPLALTIGEFDAIREQAEAAGKCVFTIHNWKKAAPMLKVWELLRTGFAGSIHHAEFHTLRQQPASSALSVKSWRQNPSLSGGGILVDHGWHAFYLLCAMTGQDPVSVTARLGFPHAGQEAVDDTAACWVDFPSCTGLVCLSWRSPCRKNIGFIHGTSGLIEIRDGDVIKEARDAQAETISTGDPLTAGSAHPAWMTPTLDDFLDEVNDPYKRGKNLREAQFCIKLITGSVRSHSMGARTVPI